MTKLVNVYTRGVIRGMRGVPIRSTAKAVRLDVEDIRACILSKAKVEEILPTGEIITLTLANYRKDNSVAAPAKEVVNETPKSEPVKVEEPKQVVEETPVVEQPVIETLAPVVEEVVAEEAPAVVEETNAEEDAAEETAVTEEAPVEEQPVYTKKTYGKKNK